MSWDLRFDVPWWLPAALAVVGAVIWMSGNRRRDTALMRIGGVALVAAAAWAALSIFVQTDKERAEADTRALVKAVVEGDSQTLERILDPRARLTVFGAETPYHNRQQIIQAARDARERFGLSAAQITSMHSEQTGPVVTVEMTVMTTQEATLARPVPSTWQLQFQETSEGWSLWTVALVEVRGVGTNRVQRELPRIERE